MTDTLRWILAAAAAFLLGSIPWGLWVGRLVRGLDVREHGSGNLGATNVYRVLGPRWGLLVLLLDAGKGVAAVLVARALLGAGTPESAVGAGAAAGTPGLAIWAGMLGLIASVLGHSFSPLAGFRGGKGVATAAGAWGALFPLALAAALAAWILCFALTRIVSLASIVACLVLPVAAAWLRRGQGPLLRDPLFDLAVLTALLILARHRSNLRRLRRGREQRLDLRPAGPTVGPEARR